MVHISILVPSNAILGSLEGSRQIMTQVNEFLQMKGQEPMFKVELVGLQKNVTLAGGRYNVTVERLVDEVQTTNLIIIPALDGDLTKAVEINKEFVPWIIDQYTAGAEVASLCLGAFLLASTGLLNGRQCATHWLAARQFCEMFPEVKLVTEKIITDEAGLYSSGGAFSYLNLILYLIEKYAGRDIAITASKIFAVEFDRNSQSRFVLFSGQKEHSDEPVRRAQEYIEQNIDVKISIEELATKFAVGRRHFERRFKKATKNTPVEYIQRVKIEAAKQQLESGRKTVSEVMYEVGYSDKKAFRDVFKKITGLSPVEYRNKYNPEVAA
jgi:transcriptional regulator GlxA family with amidase domain